jgi:hypothetical protein
MLTLDAAFLGAKQHHQPVSCSQLSAVVLQVRVDNDNPHHTVLIIDSANRPGTLVEVITPFTAPAG